MLDKLLKNKQIVQLISYGMIGFFGLGLDVGFFYLIDITSIHPSISTTISSTIAALLTYPLNAKYTFDVNDNHRKRLIGYVIVSIVGTITGALVVYLLKAQTEYSNQIIKILSVIPVALIQFTLNKFVIFKKK